MAESNLKAALIEENDVKADNKMAAFNSTN